MMDAISACSNAKTAVQIVDLGNVINANLTGNGNLKLLDVSLYVEMVLE